MADSQSGDQVPQHKRLAINGGDPQQGGNFGCESAFKSVGGEKPPRGTMKEGTRGISRPRGYHPEPDHGDAY
jgi:hypothetical protein